MMKNELKEQLHRLTSSLTTEEHDEQTEEQRNTSDLPHGDLSLLRDVKRFQHLHLRVRNIERRLASLGDFSPKKDRRDALSFTLDTGNASMMDDFNHEMHLKLVTVLNEANSLKSLFRRLTDSPSEDLPSIDIPNFGSYIPYRQRISTLEDQVLTMGKSKDVEEIRGEIEELKRERRREEKEVVMVESKQVVGNEGLGVQVAELRLGVEEVKGSVSRLEERIMEGNLHPLPEAPTTLPEFPPITGQDLDLIHQSLSQIQRGLSQRALRTELEPLIRPKYTQINRESSFSKSSQLPDQLQSKLDSLEAKMTYYLDELNRVKSLLAEKSKALDKLESQITQSTVGLESSLQRLRIELKGQISDVMTMLDRQSDDPEALKNVLAMKVVVMKLQRDLRELGNRVETLSKATHVPEIEGEAKVSSTSGIRKIDSEMKLMTQQLQSLSSDVTELQQTSQKQIDSTATRYLKHLEEVKMEVQTVMGKVSEGVRLSQREGESVAELFAIVGNKGDKSALDEKANREDLRKASQLLSQRISDLKASLHRLESAQADTRHQAREAFLTKGGSECLSCGHDTIPSKDPVRVPMGPGFSRLLGYLGTLVEEKETRHIRTRSELRSGAVTDRGRKVRLQLPDVRKRSKAEDT